MNWYLSSIYFVILLGISIYFGSKKDFQLSGTGMTFGLSTFTLIFPAEYLLFILWLGFSKGIIALEVSMLTGIPVAHYFQKGNNFNSGSALLAQNLRQNDDLKISIIYLAAYLFIKLLLVMTVAIFILKNILLWDSVSALVVLIMVVATYGIFGNYKSLMVTQSIQAVAFICGLSILSFFTINSTTIISKGIIEGLFSGNNISIWKIIIIGILYGIWQWTFEQQFVQCLKYSSGSEKILRPLAIIKSLFTILFIIAVIGFSGNNKFWAITDTYTIPAWGKIIIDFGILSIVMASLASVFNSIAIIFTEDFYHRIRPNENSWGREIIIKITITILAFISVILILIMKNAAMEQVITFFGLWLNFTIVSSLLVLLSKIITIKPITIYISYGIAMFSSLLQLSVVQKIFEKYDYYFIIKFSRNHILENSLLVIGLVMITVLGIYLFSTISIGQRKLDKERI